MDQSGHHAPADSEGQVKSAGSVENAVPALPVRWRGRVLHCGPADLAASGLPRSGTRVSLHDSLPRSARLNG